MSLSGLGRAVRRARERQGLSAAELAARAGLGEDFVEALERGEQDPWFDQLLALAAALDVAPSQLVAEAERDS